MTWRRRSGHSALSEADCRGWTASGTSIAAFMQVCSRGLLKLSRAVAPSAKEIARNRLSAGGCPQALRGACEGSARTKEQTED